MKMFLEESLELDRNTVQYKIERIPTHSRYFSDELVGSCACRHVKR